VRRVLGEVAEVEIMPASADSCASCGSCAEGPGGRILEIPAGPGIEPGRRVTVEVSEPGGLGPAFVVFLLPVLAIVLGATLGAAVPDWTGWKFLSATGFGFLGAVVFLLPVLFVIRRYDRRVQSASSRPKVIRVGR
jgi:sigma-E factor negative regulatory protein RseC